MQHANALKQLYPPVSYNINGEHFIAQCEVDGNAFDRLQQSAVEILSVLEPATSNQMLADWERICGIKTDLSKSYQERVKRVIVQLNAVGGLSIPYFTRIAESIGYQIQIKEFSPLQNDLPNPGDLLQFRNEPRESLIYMWRVTVLNGDDNIVYFRAGSSFAGDHLVEFGDPIIEEFFRDLKPAHTYCYFAYQQRDKRQMKTLLPEINSADKRFHAGNPAIGEQGTRVTDTWLNDVQERVRDMQAEAHYVLEKAGFTPKQEQQTQLYQAIVKIIDDNRKNASITQKGEVRLTSDTGLDSEELGLTAKAGKKLAQLIATVQLALNNYIPLNKRSSAVNSNDENNVATSKAVKTAYDKGVEARIAAYAANNNANGRVSKSGDTMTGSLAITGSQSGGFANGLMLKNKAGGQNTGVFVDFYQTDNIPRASMWMSDAGNNSTQISFHNTPEGADWNRDSRQGVFTITSSGNLWSKAYGFLHDKFASKSDVYAKSRFRHQWYGNHYEGAEVFDVPMGDNGVMRTIIMGATIHGYAKLNLPESFNGTCRVQVMDVGNGRHVVGANIQNGNVVEVFNSGQTGLNIIAIGWYGW